MNILFNRSGKLIPPHLDHTLKSFYYTSNVPIFYLDENGGPFAGYPKNHFAFDVHYETIASEFLKAKDYLLSGLSEQNHTFTFCIGNYYTFLLAPVMYQETYKGTLIAGPIHLCSCYNMPQYIEGLSPHLVTQLNKATQFTRPPRHFYLSQLMHHLMQRSVYIGPSDVLNPLKHFISPSDMTLRAITNDTNNCIQLIAQMVLSQQKQEALSIYKKNLLFQDYGDESENQLDLLKQALITLECTISSVLLSSDYDSQKVLTLKSAFFQQFIQSNDFIALINSGENMIKVYAESLKRNALEGKSQPVRKAIIYIQENFRHPLCLNDICDYVKRSRTYLSARFKKEMHTTISDYINKTRVDYSRHLLEHTDMSILDIALESGFDSQNYYATVFKKNYKQTPSEFRSKNTD